MMKMKETLTNEQRANMLLNGEVVGIFQGMILPTDPFFDLAHSMCLGYYTVRSANKIVAPIYEQMLEFAKENSDVVDSDYITLANTLLGSSIIRPKFIEKWLRVYDTLITKQYDSLKGFEHTEHRDGNNSDITIYDTSLGKIGSNNDTITYDTNIEDNGSIGTKETTTTNRNNLEGVYGFNSANAVKDNEESGTETETVVGNADENTSQNIQTKTGTESKVNSVNETETKTGTDTKNFVIDEDVTKSGRNSTGAELVEAELNLRNTQIFFDIVYKDIDSVATLQLYI